MWSCNHSRPNTAMAVTPKTSPRHNCMAVLIFRPVEMGEITVHQQQGEQNNKCSHSVKVISYESSYSQLRFWPARFSRPERVRRLQKTPRMSTLQHSSLIYSVFKGIAVLRDSALYWNLRRAWWYLRSNDRYLVNYSRRHLKGLPISSAIAESAVNELVSWRMVKKRRMRWSDVGAHLLAKVRMHDFNGDLHPRVFAFALRQPKPSHDCGEFASPMCMAA